jgi:hypothetical protein
MRRNPGVCPFCKKRVTPSRYVVTRFMRLRQLHQYKRNFYSCCGFYWPST